MCFVDISLGLRKEVNKTRQLHKLDIPETVNLIGSCRKSETCWNPFRPLCLGRREGQGCFHDDDCGDRMECTGLLGNQTCRCITPYLLNADGSCGTFIWANRALGYTGIGLYVHWVIRVLGYIGIGLYGNWTIRALCYMCIGLCGHLAVRALGYTGFRLYGPD